MPIDLNGPSAKEKLEQIASGEDALTVKAEKSGEDVRAAVEISHDAKRWSVAGFVDYVKRKGWGAGGKATIKLGE